MVGATSNLRVQRHRHFWRWVTGQKKLSKGEVDKNVEMSKALKSEHKEKFPSPFAFGVYFQVVLYSLTYHKLLQHLRHSLGLLMFHKSGFRGNRAETEEPEVQTSFGGRQRHYQQGTQKMAVYCKSVAICSWLDLYSKWKRWVYLRLGVEYMAPSETIRPTMGICTLYSVHVTSIPDTLARWAQVTWGSLDLDKRLLGGEIGMRVFRNWWPWGSPLLSDSSEREPDAPAAKVTMEGENFFTRIKADFARKSFLPLKFLYFLLFGGQMTINPFMSLYMRSIGILQEEMAYIYSFTPVLGVLVPPLCGMIADRVGNFKMMMSVVMLAAGLSAPLYLAVPTARIVHDMPEKLPFSLTCSMTPGQPPALMLQTPYECDLQNKTKEIILSVNNCSPCGSNQLCTKESVSNACPEPLKSFAAKEIKASVLHAVVKEKANPNHAFLKVEDSTCPDIGVQGDTQGQDCAFTCQVVTNMTALCKNKESLEPVDPPKSVFIYLIMRVIQYSLLTMTLTLFTGAVMAVLTEKNGDFGLQRLYSNIACIIMAPISGALIDYASEVNGYPDFRPAILMHLCLLLVSSILNLNIDLEFKKPNSNIIHDCKILLKDPEIVVFLIVMIASGMCFGILETFLFWLLQDLGASKKLMGLTVTVGQIAGIPILAISSWIISKLGHVNTINFGFVILIIRLLGCSWITNPWQVMPFEALECFSVSLKVAAATTYAGILATPATVATLQGLHSGLHYGVGNGLGSLVGALLLQYMDTRGMYRVTAFATSILVFIYFILYQCIFKSRYLKRLEDLRTHQDAADKQC
ncbi:uncharacterized protein LOC143033512 [Oratosquilla oratoria]|uniref:uncharacterized protein LOC143033512 n=1 Tax=Oratosquilla oratoria TaxID=337810 RepID=UPI003F7574E3